MVTTVDVNESYMTSRCVKLVRTSGWPQRCNGWLYRIEAREKKARYSRAQDVARRRAADELRNSRRGEQPWWERVSAGFANLGAMAASYVEVRYHVSFVLFLAVPTSVEQSQRRINAIQPPNPVMCLAGCATLQYTFSTHK